MSTTAVKKTISLRITPTLYEHIKKVSSKENKSINNYVETALLSFSNFYGVSDSYEPNEETKKAILQGNEEKKKGLLKKYKDLDRLFNDLAKGLDE
jgi:hypothetical protein